MYFSIDSIEGGSRNLIEQQEDKVKLTVSSNDLEDAFAHLLSISGKEAVNWLKLNIKDRFKKWNDPNTCLYAPISSFFQSSGSGKSKLAVELIQEGPGFYTCLRASNSSDTISYPFNNSLSDTIKQLATMRDIKNSTDLKMEKYSSNSVGLILLLLAKMSTFYLRQWQDKIIALRSVHPLKDIHSLAKLACADLGKRFYSNHNLDFKSDFIESEALEKFVLEKASNLGRIGTEPTVYALAQYIKEIFDGPIKVATKIVDSEVEKSTWAVMKRVLEVFPFVVILDEADELNELSKDNYSFVSLRNAISYLLPCTKMFFLTLGTKSDVHDLKPPIITNSTRGRQMNESLPPIVLLANSSIYSQHEYPIEEVIFDYEVVRNPLFFKYLVTLGHPMWASIPFPSIIFTARTKLVNDSESLKYIIAIWMIRAGLMASPTEISTRTLIASHMATLFDFNPELTRMIVFYPSEPVLAIACREQLQSLNVSNKSDVLFSKLEEMLEAVQVDRGELSEIIGSMTVLIAIDQATNSARHDYDDVNAMISQLNDKLPKFKSLWEKKYFILEPDSENTSRCTHFPGYHVVTVRDFLKSFLNGPQFEKINLKLPETTLNGILNASHCVKITRIDDNLELTINDEIVKFPAIKLPVADPRIYDNNCNLIDESMLKFGLIRQCMFLMPDRYYGIDLVVPVILENGTFTFLAVQYKTGSVAVAEPINKMQARFHLVKCTESLNTYNTQDIPETDSESNEGIVTATPSRTEVRPHDPSYCPRCSINVCEKGRDHQVGCKKCDYRKKLASIYDNQVSLLISMDSSCIPKFVKSMTTFLNKPNREQSEQVAKYNSNVLDLEKALYADDDEASREFLSNVEFKSSIPFDPLISIREPIKSSKGSNQLSLVTSMWHDDKIDPSQKKKKVDFSDASETDSDREDSVSFYPDGFRHRQYCIAVRGLEPFEHLFKAKNSIENALKLLQRKHFFMKLEGEIGFLRQVSILKSILYEASTNYLDYNYNLARMRGINQEVGYPVLLSFLERHYEKEFCITPAAGAKRSGESLVNPKLSKNPTLVECEDDDDVDNNNVNDNDDNNVDNV